jgi:peptidoglycan hydrolase-like protein with peptidoglycan-binding domain
MLTSQVSSQTHSRKNIMVSTVAICTSNPLLQKGSEGKDVKDLQKMLNSKMGNKQQIGVDGIFGAATEKLAKVMQYRYFLDQDGKVGADTWHVLCINTLVEKPQLRTGSSGVLVKRVQNVLKDASYYTGAIDGVFGTQMDQAVKTMQSKRGLQQDGVIGDRTWKVLVEITHQLTAT